MKFYEKPQLIKGAEKEKREKVEKKLLYHTAFHLILKSGRAINFFEPKSIKTQKIDKKLEAKSDQIPGLQNLAQIRDNSFFLAKENEGGRGYDTIAFNIEKLLSYGFQIYEANAEAADHVYSSSNKFQEQNVKEYLQSFKEIKSSDDCLDYHSEIFDDYDACRQETIYRPYLPEYLVIPPDQESVNKLIAKNKEKLQIIAEQYNYVYNPKDIKQLMNKKRNNSREINLDELDILNKEEDYHLIVNLLFNASILKIEKVKRSNEEKYKHFHDIKAERAL